MSIWRKLADSLSALAAGEGLRGFFAPWRPPPERSIAFTIGVIALGAKLAKADGTVTRDEIAVFRSIFVIPPGEEGNAAHVFNLARTDVAGFEEYAASLARLFRAEPGEADPMLEDVLEGLFQIAMADGDYHEAEDAFLARVAEIFHIPRDRFECMRARIVQRGEDDPYRALGADRGMPLAEIRRRWREAVMDSHPDRLAARGVPEEAVRLAEARLATVNRAWEAIRDRHAA
ncbi:MAG: DnaJ family molecular chaperone [Rhodobacteraceae bacterium]|nr:DnaJ family molecular chaperone [Paracoccaceae bacterium]